MSTAHALTAHSIRYAGLMAAVRGESAGAVAARLMEKLPPLWDLSYREMTGYAGEITQVREPNLVYHSDADRVVVAYGFSRPDGQLDMDLLPHRPELIQGHQDRWSSRGVAFRSVVQWCVEHPGTFLFARPVYLRRDRAPDALEFGVLRGAEDLWVERFPG